ncbi:MAG TPA: PKD domain-containing protein [Methanospirillum sp.]|nr:PKD domain-containing protein [Methanospirillum sp.]
MMGNVKPVWCLVLSILLVTCTLGTAEQVAGENRTAEGAIASMPLVFIENNGQYDDNVSYQAVSSPEQVVTVLQNGVEFSQGDNNGTQINPVFMMLDGANKDTKIIGLDQVNGTANFFYGTNQSAWVTGASLSNVVSYNEVYPGISLNLSGKSGILKSEFTVLAGADPSVITLQYQGQDSISLNETGDLIIRTAGREIKDEAPYAYQESNGTKVQVPCSYILDASSNKVTFSLGTYDKTKTLVIDPVLRYSLYFGGTGRDQGNSISVDNDGYAYFIGTSWSDHLKYFQNQNQTGQMSALGLVPGSVQPYFGGGDKDAFVIKIDPDGTNLVYITYIGGSGTDEGTGLVIDAEGSAYVTGGTNSNNFPVKNAYRKAKSGGYDAWVAKIDPNGKDMTFATYLGGVDDDYGFDVAIDDKKNVFITGQTKSWDFPVVNRYQLSPFGGLGDAFITKLNAEGNTIVYSNFIGGSAYEAGSAVTIDTNGYACIVGQTESPNFPVIKPYQSGLKGEFDAFVTKFDPEGKYPAAYSTYLGGDGWDDAQGVISHPDGRLTVTGSTKSTNFPTLNPIQPALQGLQDGFLATLNPDGSALTEATFFGGSLIDSISGVTRDDAGNLFIVGTTDSPDLPINRAYQSKLGGKSDVMIAKFTPDINQTVFCTYLGGSDIDEGRGIAVTGEGDSYVTGYTTSINFPKVWPYQQNFGDGDRDAFVAVLSEHDMIPVTDFIGEPTEGDAPLTVQFTDKSLGIPTSWLWDFGDQGTSTEKNPKHVYEKPGVYTVSLTATNIVSSQKKTKENYITALDPVKPPVADFSASPQAGIIPLSVAFSDLTTNKPTSWSWIFGDGATSVEQNPVHIYTVAGTYTVNLTASNKAGSSSKEKPEFITASPNVTKPVADFTADPTSGMVPLSVRFTDISKNGPTSWLWTFGDGATSAEQNPTHIYTTAGKYSVTLNATNSAGSDSITKPELITAQPAVIKPVADFGANPTSGMVPLQVTFTDLSKNNPTAWRWDFGDLTTATDKNPVHVYTKEGTYSVTLNVSNSAGSDQITKPELITAQPAVIKPVADFAANPTTGYAPLQVTFTDLSKNNPTAWRWDFGDLTTATDKNPVHVFTLPGVYSVTLNVSNSAGSDQITKPNLIQANTPIPQPIAEFDANPTSGKAPLTVQFTDRSSGEPNKWLWEFGDNTKSEEKNPSHIYTSPGIYDVTLTVWNTVGISQKTKPALITVDSPVDPPIADFSGSPTIGVAPLKVSFIDLSQNSPKSWVWGFGDGQNGTEQNPVHTYTTPGTYSVELSVSNEAGIDRKVIPDYISVKKPGCPPDAQFRGAPTSGTAPLSVSFTDLSGGNPDKWTWNFGDGSTSEQQHPEHTYQAPGEYTVSLTAVNEFGDSTEVRERYITVVEKPVPLKASFMGEPTSGTAPLSVKFSDLSTGGPQSWLWNFGDGGSAIEQNPTHVYAEPGDYTVYLTAIRGEDRSTEIRYQYIHVSPAGKAPIPDFVASPVSGKAPLNVCFTDISLNNPTSWRWDFGDGEIGTEQHPTHTYRNPGTYAVCLEASNAFGSAKACKQNFITVTEPPTEAAEFFGQVTIDGEMAPIGSGVEARGSGVETGITQNPVTISMEGNYGTPDPLLVKGTVKNGEPLTFWIRMPETGEYVQAECYDVYGGTQWTSTYPFRSGDKTRLDLRVGECGIPPMPVLPHEFFGEVTYNGAPLASGSMLTVKGENIIEGHRGNPLPITSPGIYGFESLQKLVAQGELKAGQPFTFWVTPAGSTEPVKGQVRDVEGGGEWTDAYLYKEGGLTRLDIKAEGGNPPVPTIPMTISGSVLIDGTSASIGSLVSADGAGVRVGIDGNPVQVNKPGLYGDSSKLTIQGDITEGIPLTFAVYDAQSGNEFVAEIKDPKTGEWMYTYPFKAGDDEILDLRATSVIPMAVNSSKISN